MCESEWLLCYCFALRDTIPNSTIPQGIPWRAEHGGLNPLRAWYELWKKNLLAVPVGVVTHAIMEHVRILSRDWMDDVFTVTIQKSVMFSKNLNIFNHLYEKGTANKWLSDSTRKLPGGGDALTRASAVETAKHYHESEDWFRINHQNLEKLGGFNRLNALLYYGWLPSEQFTVFHHHSSFPAQTIDW